MGEIIFTSIITAIFSFFAFLLSNVYYGRIKEFKELKSKTSYLLVFYANIYSNPIDIAKTNNTVPDDYNNASNELRKLAAEWIAFVQVKPHPSFFIASDNIIVEASKELIGLSNSMILPYNSNDDSCRASKVNHDISNKIKALLKIKDGSKQ